MRSGWFLVLVCGLSACRTPERGPNLVEIEEVRPRHVEVGDRLRLVGSGFPEGRVGEVTLRGDLLRPGEPPLDVELVAEAELVSPHALELAVTRDIAAKLCGGADARHTTFRGDVEVAFAPRAGGGSGVSGRLDGIVVDVTPESQAPSAVTALRAQGERFARFLGLELAHSDEGLVVAKIEERSRAARSGLVPGDVLSELDGMVLRGLSDFIPAANARTSFVLAQRGGDSVPVRVDSAGFRYSSPDTLSSAVALLGLALVAFLLFVSPLGRVLGFFERRVTERLRESALAKPAERVTPARRVPSLVRELSRKLPTGFLPYFGLVVTSALFTLLALGKSVVASELDLLVVPAATGFAALALALLTGESNGRFSLAAGLRRALALLALTTPLIALLVTAALGTGSLRADDLVRAQGAWPWQWGLFESPVLLVAGVLAFAALVPRARRVPVLAESARPSARDRFHDLAQGTHELVSAGVLSVVLLGGWQLGAAGSTLAVSVLGALVLLSKSWSVLLALAFVRWALGGVDLRMLGVRAHLALALPSALCVGIAVAFRRTVQSPVLTTLEAGLGPALFLGGVLATAWFFARILHGVRTSSTEPSIQPWV